VERAERPSVVRARALRRTWALGLSFMCLNKITIFLFFPGFIVFRSLLTGVWFVFRGFVFYWVFMCLIVFFDQSGRGEPRNVRSSGG